MDSEHRHELKENDLEQFLRNFKEWWGKHGNFLLVVILLAVLVFGGVRLYRGRLRDLHNQAWSDLANATSPEVYRQVVSEHDNPTVQALALLRAGDLQLQRATQPPQTDSLGQTKPETTLSPADRQAALEDATGLYQQVLQQDTAPPLIKLNARVGLASIAEARKQWDQARELWEAVKKDAGDTLPVIRAQAEGRLAMLDQLKSPVEFAPDKPAITPNIPGNENAKPSPEPDTKKPADDAAKPEPKPETPKPDAKPEPKPETPKPDAKPQTKPEPKPDAPKPDAKPEPKPDTKPEPGKSNP
jgi:predicted negative regulator of RcsB-dependent stress response